MMANYNRERRHLKSLFNGIEAFCAKCDECCFTYGWILPCEVEKFLMFDDLVYLNGNLVTLDSFEKDLKGKRITAKIPRCKFYSKQSCLIHNIKPFDCLLYPIKVLYNERRGDFSVVISEDCPYIKDVIKNSQIQSKAKEIKKIFDAMNPSLKKEYFLYVKKWRKISKDKRFKNIKVCEYSEKDIFKKI